MNKKKILMVLVLLMILSVPQAMASVEASSSDTAEKKLLLPIIEIVRPETGMLYIMDIPIWFFPNLNTAVIFGKITCEANVTSTSPIRKVDWVFIDHRGESHIVESSQKPPYSCTYTGFNWGKLKIIARAWDSTGIIDVHSIVVWKFF